MRVLVVIWPRDNTLGIKWWRVKSGKSCPVLMVEREASSLVGGFKSVQQLCRVGRYN
jgi:hypothetical protein